MGMTIPSPSVNVKASMTMLPPKGNVHEGFLKKFGNLFVPEHNTCLTLISLIEPN